ncbi:MAG: carboxylate--amine ligase, partial [Bacilli bacterium]|nr:carboxylate--amine ligase [Bacilli bacterium]
KDEKILLVSSNETYGEFIAKNQKDLKDKFYFNYPSVKLQHTLVNKEDFYKTYEDSVLDLPDTYYYDCSKDTKIKRELTYPVIVKPANVIMFKHMEFAGKKKIYRLNNLEEVEHVIDLFKKGGYTDTLIIQEYIPGDDSYLFDAVVYVDKNHKTKLVSFAQIGLQEHNSRMIGNAAVIINGYSEHPGVEEQIKKITKFMDAIGYQGFAEFDMKYDARTKKYKVMEINARQGRCSYYITPCGYNLIEVLARDLIDNEELEYKIIDKVQLETFVSKSIAKKYITNKKYLKKVLQLWNKRVMPLNYKKDTDLRRKLLLKKIQMNYNRDYKNSKWDWK